MNYTIHKNEHSVYLQLYTQLRRDIIEGVYPYGSKLPSKRLLADETGVSTITVEHAYALLCDEGYATSNQRSGYFVVFRQSDGFAAAAAAPVQTPVSHTSHQYPDFSLSILSKTMRKVLTDYAETILDKSPNSGCSELREALRQYLARNRGIRVGIDQIIIGSGSEYLYKMIIELLGREQVFAIESPSYKQIKQVY